MPNKSTRRIEALRKEYREWSVEAQKDKEIERRRRRKEIDGKIASLEYRVYNLLRKAIYSSCGLENGIEFFSSRHELQYVSDDEALTMMCLFHAHTGLKVEQVKKEHSWEYIRVTLCDEAKEHHILCDGEDFCLDFPALIEENKWRRKLWKENLTVTAKWMLDMCEKALRSTPERFYGFLEEMAVLQYRNESHSSSPFEGELQIGQLLVNYKKLTAEQIGELREVMNRMIVGGWVEFDPMKYSFDSLQMRINRSSVKVMVDEPYFDYGKLCAEYDEMTPGLKAKFDTIVAGAKFPEAKEQLSMLTPGRPKMVYRLKKEDGISFRLLKRIEGTVHVGHLMEMFAERMPGITVTDVRVLNREASYPSLRGCGWHTESIDERVVLSVEIDETATDKVAVRQLEIEQAICYIKKHQAWQLADTVIGLVLDAVGGTEGHLVQFRTNYPWEKFGNGVLTIPLTGRAIKRLASSLDCEVSEFAVDLAEVQDEAFVKRLQDTIYRRSGGAIEVNFGYRQYRLCLDKKS